MPKSMKRMRVLALSSVLALHAAFVLPASARADVLGDRNYTGALGADDSTGPTARVRLPPPGQHGFPFMSTILDLGKYGYEEQEFLISGTATAYVPTSPLGDDGRWAVAPNPGVTAPYTVRLLVRRPVDPDRFNGTVVVEWFNETPGFDSGNDWGFLHEELLREGYAYVGVTAQYAGAAALQAWETGPGARYAAVVHPGESFAYDIYSQAGRAIKAPRAGDPRPLGNLTGEVRALIADGESQSGNWLVTYHNAVQPLANVYSGFLIQGAGWGMPLSIDTADFFGNPIPPGVPVTSFIDTPWTRLRDDLNVQVMLLLTEADVTDFIGAGRMFHQMPNTQHLAVWEVAGASHFDQREFDSLNPDISNTYPGGGFSPTCNGAPINPGNTHAYAMHAALHALNRWTRSGVLPAQSPRFDLTVPPLDDFTAEVIVHRDPKTGIALGGIRLPDVSVPIGTLTGLASDPNCLILGAFDPWDHDSDLWDGQAGVDPSPTPEPDLQLLYGNHTGYVLRVGVAAADSVAGRFLRPADALALVGAAQRASVP